MAKYLDLLLTLFPFEKQCFAATKLPVQYTGHPLTAAIRAFKPTGKFSGKILSIFPGSRKGEIERNLPIQLKVARRLRALDPSLQIAISTTQFKIEAPDTTLIAPEDHYELMRASHLAIATSGTVTLELALHGTPAVVNFAINRLDCFIAQKILRINLPFYCLANIAVNKQVFPELFGPNLTEEKLFFWARKLWFEPEARADCLAGCEEVKRSLGTSESALLSAKSILQLQSE